MADYWHEGYCCGVLGYTWLRTVRERMLKGWERKELADGWRAGLADRPSMLEDMQCDARTTDPDMPL